MVTNAVFSANRSPPVLQSGPLIKKLFIFKLAKIFAYSFSQWGVYQMSLLNPLLAWIAHQRFFLFVCLYYYKPQGKFVFPITGSKGLSFFQ